MGSCASVAANGDEKRGESKNQNHSPTSRDKLSANQKDGNPNNNSFSDSGESSDEDTEGKMKEDPDSNSENEDSGASSDSDFSSGDEDSSGENNQSQSVLRAAARRKRRKKRRSNKAKVAHQRAAHELELRMAELNNGIPLQEENAPAVLETPGRNGGNRSSVSATSFSASGILRPRLLSLPFSPSGSQRPSAVFQSSKQFNNLYLNPMASPHHPSFYTLNPSECVNINILLADTDEGVRAVTERWLIECKYEVVCCENGEEAAELLHEAAAGGDGNCDIDVVICDWRLRTNSGENLLDWAATNTHLSKVPFIVLCDDEVSVEGVDRIIRRGAIDVLRKPLIRRIFLNSVSTIVKSAAEATNAQKLKERGDEYKQQLMIETAHGGLPMGFATPRRALSSMINTLALASPRVALPHVLSSRSSTSIVDSIHAVFLSSQLSLFSTCSQWLNSVALSLHHCNTPHEAVQIVLELEHNSSAHAVAISDSTNASPLKRSICAPGEIFSVVPTPTSSMRRMSIERSVAYPQCLSLEPQPIHTKYSKSVSINGNFMHVPENPFSPNNHIPINSSKTHFGIELVIVDAAILSDIACEEFFSLLKSRGLQRVLPLPIVVLADEGFDYTILRTLRPLVVSVLPHPMTRDSLLSRINLLHQSISVARHQRLFALRAQTYRSLLRSIRNRTNSASVPKSDSEKPSSTHSTYRKISISSPAFGKEEWDSGASRAL